MKIIISITILICVTITGFCQDYNYEFLTDGTAIVNLGILSSNELDTLHLECRVIKKHDNLIIVSNKDLGNVRFEGKVKCVGRKINGDLVYNHFISNDRQYWIIVNPSDGVIRIRNVDGDIEAMYGTRLVTIPITNDF